MRAFLILFVFAFGVQCNTGTKQESATENNTPIDQSGRVTYYTTTDSLRSNTIPEEVFGMTGLIRLAITGMDCDTDSPDCWHITEIPAGIGNLKKLESLSLAVNGIGELPAELGTLTSLKALNLTDNPGLSNIDPVVHLENLEELMLFGCGLSKLPDNIGQLKKLKKLGLIGTNLDSVEVKRVEAALPGCEVMF